MSSWRRRRMYNKQVWKDEIPDLTRPIIDSNGKQKTDPQTGRPLFELVQEGTRITATRLNTMEGGIENAHSLVEKLAKEIGGNFVAAIDGVMGLVCSAEGLKASWTEGVAYVDGRRYEVTAGEMALNPTQGQYLYVDVDGAVKKTTSEATAKTGLLLFYVATDTSAVISSKDRRQNINLEELIKRVESVELPEDLINQVQQIPRDYVRYPAFATTQGTPAAYTVTLNPAPLAFPGLPEGMGITIVPHKINTANPSLKINDFSAMPLRNVNGQALKSWELKAGIPQMFRHINGAFVAVSPVETAEALKFAASNGMTSTNVQDAITEVFQSGSEFKTEVAEAITAKGQTTSATDPLQTFVDNINAIQTGKYKIGDNIEAFNLTPNIEPTASSVMTYYTTDNATSFFKALKDSLGAWILTESRASSMHMSIYKASDTRSPVPGWNVLNAGLYIPRDVAVDIVSNTIVACGIPSSGFGRIYAWNNIGEQIWTSSGSEYSSLIQICVIQNRWVFGITNTSKWVLRSLKDGSVVSQGNYSSSSTNIRMVGFAVGDTSSVVISRETSSAPVTTLFEVFTFNSVGALSDIVNGPALTGRVKELKLRHNASGSSPTEFVYVLWHPGVSAVGTASLLRTSDLKLAYTVSIDDSAGYISTIQPLVDRSLLLFQRTNVGVKTHRYFISSQGLVTYNYYFGGSAYNNPIFSGLNPDGTVDILVYDGSTQTTNFHLEFTANRYRIIG